MLNLKFIQENKDTVIRKLAVKNFDAKELVEKIIALDNERKNLQKESDNKQSEMTGVYSLQIYEIYREKSSFFERREKRGSRASKG